MNSRHDTSNSFTRGCWVFVNIADSLFLTLGSRDRAELCILLRIICTMNTSHTLCLSLLEECSKFVTSFPVSNDRKNFAIVTEESIRLYQNYQEFKRKTLHNERILNAICVPNISTSSPNSSFLCVYFSSQGSLVVLDSSLKELCRTTFEGFVPHENFKPIIAVRPDRYTLYVSFDAYVIYAVELSVRDGSATFESGYTDEHKNIFSSEINRIVHFDIIKVDGTAYFPVTTRNTNTHMLSLSLVNHVPNRMNPLENCQTPWENEVTRYDIPISCAHVSFATVPGYGLFMISPKTSAFYSGEGSPRTFKNSLLSRQKSNLNNRIQFLPQTSYSLIHGNLYLFSCTDSGYCTMTKVKPERLYDVRNKSTLRWDHLDIDFLGDIPNGTIEYFTNMHDSNFLLVSKLKGIMVFDAQEKTIIAQYPYENKTMFYSNVLAYHNTNLSSLVVCGGYTETVGFVETRKYMYPESIIAMEGSFGSNVSAISSFWPTQDGLYWNAGQLFKNCERLQSKECIYVTFDGRILMEETHNCVGGIDSLSGTNFKYVEMLSDGRITFDGKECHTSSSELQIQNYKASRNYTLSSAERLGHTVPNYTLVAWDNTVQCYHFNKLLKTYTFENIGIIQDVIAKIVPSSTGGSFAFIITSSRGHVRVFDSNWGEICTFQATSRLPSSICNIPHSERVLIYNHNETYMLNVVDGEYAQLASIFQAKQIKHEYGNKFVALGLDDKFTVFKINDLIETKPRMIKKQYTSLDHVFTKFVVLKGSEYIVLISTARDAGGPPDRYYPQLHLFSLRTMEEVFTYGLSSYPCDSFITDIIELAFDGGNTTNGTSEFKGNGRPRRFLVALNCTGKDNLLLFKIKDTRLVLENATATRFVITKLEKYSDNIVFAVGERFRAYKIDLRDNTFRLDAISKAIEQPGSLGVGCFIQNSVLTIIDTLKGMHEFAIGVDKGDGTLEVSNRPTKYHDFFCDIFEYEFSTSVAVKRLSDKEQRSCGWQNIFLGRSISKGDLYVAVSDYLNYVYIYREVDEMGDHELEYSARPSFARIKLPRKIISVVAVDDNYQIGEVFVNPIEENADTNKEPLFLVNTSDGGVYMISRLAGTPEAGAGNDDSFPEPSDVCKAYGYTLCEEACHKSTQLEVSSELKLLKVSGLT